MHEWSVMINVINDAARYNNNYCRCTVQTNDKKPNFKT